MACCNLCLEWYYNHGHAEKRHLGTWSLSITAWLSECMKLPRLYYMVITANFSNNGR
jgi:hypothetical protein